VGCVVLGKVQQKFSEQVVAHTSDPGLGFETIGVVHCRFRQVNCAAECNLFDLDSVVLGRNVFCAVFNVQQKRLLHACEHTQLAGTSFDIHGLGHA
jgi:hypothetical protein